MTKPKLYLFIGYPGAGKTTVAKIIAETTGAVHLSSDRERHQMFGQPTHSHEESVQLYEALNTRAGELLAAGQSVVFDTNFNFYEDRRKLREIAASHGAETVVIWITVPLDIAKDRAVHAAYSRNGYSASMTEQQFDAIIAKLEPPAKDKKVIKIDGTKLDRPTVVALLRQ
jgi:predicted kinase